MFSKVIFDFDMAINARLDDDLYRMLYRLVDEKKKNVFFFDFNLQKNCHRNGHVINPEICICIYLSKIGRAHV